MENAIVTASWNVNDNSSANDDDETTSMLLLLIAQHFFENYEYKTPRARPPRIPRVRCDFATSQQDIRELFRFT